MRGVFQFPPLSRLSPGSLPALFRLSPTPADPSSPTCPAYSCISDSPVHLFRAQEGRFCAPTAKKTAIRAQEGRFCARTADKSSSVRRKGVFAHGLLKKDSDPVEGRLLSGGQWEYGINVILGQSEQAPDLVIGRSELIAESTGKIELLCS